MVKGVIAALWICTFLMCMEHTHHVFPLPPQSQDTNYWGTPNTMTTAANTSSSTTMVTRTTNDKKTPPPFHLLYGLKGNSSEFFDEFEISLKSVLMNAPLDHPLHIHAMADPRAVMRLQQMLLDLHLPGSKHWRQPTEFHIYTIAQPFEDDIWETLRASLNSTSLDQRVGMGAFYRLFAHKVLPPTIDSVVYMDTDTVVLDNFQGLLHHLLPPNNYSLRIGRKDMSSGFLIVHPPRMPAFWKAVQTLPNAGWVGDQALIHKVMKTFPDLVGDIPLSWTTHMSPNSYKVYTTREDRPFSSVLHFSGLYGGGFFHKDGTGVAKHCKGDCLNDVQKFVNFKSTWGLADYYVNIPWTWALAHCKSRVSLGDEGHVFQVHWK